MDETNSVDDAWETPPDEPTVSAHPEHAARANRRDDWLVNVSGQDVVHMTTHEIIVALQSQKLSEHALVWRGGMPEWLELVQVPALSLVAQRAASARHHKEQESADGPRPSSAPMGAPRPQLASSAHYVAPHNPAPRNPQPVGEPKAGARPVLKPPPKDRARASAAGLRAARRTLPGVGGARAVSAGNSEVTLASAATNSAGGDAVAGPDTNVIAVYDRPAPTLQFSDSAAREWRGPVEPEREVSPKPAPALLAANRQTVPPAANRQTVPPANRETVPPAPRERSSRSSAVPSSAPAGKISSLAPAVTSVMPARADSKPGIWEDVSMVAAGQMRAMRAASVRIAILASVASALAASAITVFVVTRVRPPPAGLQAALTPKAAAKPEAKAEPIPEAPQVAKADIPAVTSAATEPASVVEAKPEPVAPKPVARSLPKPKARWIPKPKKPVEPKPIAEEVADSSPSEASAAKPSFDNPYAEDTPGANANSSSDSASTIKDPAKNDVTKPASEGKEPALPSSQREVNEPTSNTGF